MLKKVIFLSVIATCLTFHSCKKTPGQGGNARIRGKVWVKKYDPFFTILQHEYYGPNVNVIMTFGEDTSPDLTVQTNSSGEFEFQYIRKGKYKITVYSQVFRDSIHPSGSVPIENIVNITKQKEIVDIGTLTIQN
jgi:hypothetical protein